MSAAADWRNPHQTYTNKHEREKNVLEDQGQERKDRKAAQLQSNILTHEDENLNKERLAGYDKSKQRVFAASNADWSAQTGYAKANNTGSRGNAYGMRQRELESEVLPKSDYTHMKPMNKK